MLLAEAAPSCNLFDPSIIIDAWRRYTSEGVDASPVTMHRILSVLGSINSRLDDESRRELIEDFKARLLKFDSPTEIIGSMVSALSKVCSPLPLKKSAYCQFLVALIPDWMMSHGGSLLKISNQGFSSLIVLQRLLVLWCQR